MDLLLNVPEAATSVCHEDFQEVHSSLVLLVVLNWSICSVLEDDYYHYFYVIVLWMLVDLRKNTKRKKKLEKQVDYGNSHYYLELGMCKR